jgi:hypothetical protein
LGGCANWDKKEKAQSNRKDECENARW